MANLGSETETCVGSHVHLVGASVSFEKNFYRLPFTPLSLICHIGASDTHRFRWQLLVFTGRPKRGLRSRHIVVLYKLKPRKSARATEIDVEMRKCNAHLLYLQDRSRSSAELQVLPPCWSVNASFIVALGTVVCRGSCSQLDPL
jgi:hypothetical protein